MRIMSFEQDIVTLRNSKRYYTKIDERAFLVALDFLSSKQCLAGDSQIFEYHDFASKSLVNVLTG